MPNFPKNEPIQDLALARGVVAGEETALATLYGRYADPLFAFIYHRLGGPQTEVEDIWQETLLAGMRSIGSFDGRCQLFTWLCSIANHKVADYCRRQGRQLEWIGGDSHRRAGSFDRRQSAA